MPPTDNGWVTKALVADPDGNPSCHSLPRSPPVVVEMTAGDSDLDVCLESVGILLRAGRNRVERFIALREDVAGGMGGTRSVG